VTLRSWARVASRWCRGRGTRLTWAAFETHADSEHFKRLVLEEAVPNLLESRDRTFFVPLVDD
jgi:hypothetical protein